MLDKVDFYLELDSGKKVMNYKLILWNGGWIFWMLEVFIKVNFINNFNIMFFWKFFYCGYLKKIILFLFYFNFW